MSEKDVLLTAKAAADKQVLSLESRAGKSDEEVIKLKQLSEKLLREKQQMVSIDNATGAVGGVKPTVVSVAVDATTSTLTSTTSIGTETDQHQPPPPLPLSPHTDHTHHQSHYRDRDLATIAELNERIEALTAMKTSSHKKIAEMGQQNLLHQGI